MFPAYTKTRFHTGVQVDGERVSNFFAGLLDEQDTGEYYRKPGLSDVEAARALVAGHSPAGGSHRRRRARSLPRPQGFHVAPGSLRLDRSNREPHPYTVTEQNFAVRMLQARGVTDTACFFTHPREALYLSDYERNPIDPRISHAFTLAVDDFGNVLRSRQPSATADVSSGLAAQEEQTRLLISCAETAYTNAVEEDDDYRSPLP
jgi:hypothetical protein